MRSIPSIHGLGLLAVLLAAPPARADEPTRAPLPESRAPGGGRSQVLLLPVVIGDAPGPAPHLLEALARGLRENVNWDLRVPGPGSPLEPLPPGGLAEPIAVQVQSALEAAEPLRAAHEHVAVAATVSTAFQALVTASEAAPLGDRGTTLLQRVGAVLLAAQAGAAQQAEAAATAVALKLLLPGRPLGEAEGFTFVTAALVKAAPVNEGAPLVLQSNPRGCAIHVDGHLVGPSPVELVVRPGSRYAAEAHCDPDKQGVKDSFPRAVGIEPDRATETTTIVLDAVFPSVLTNDARGTWLRFADPEQRRSMEEAYVRRAAERFGASSVVLASVGEFQGAPWLNARLYLSSGYKNRHALARLEAARVVALGRYLSTGRESPGVLNAEEAGNMVAASRSLRPLGQVKFQRKPWYADVPGWVLLGTGAAGLSLGLWADAQGDDRRREAERNTRNDPIRRDELNAEASRYKFWGGVGTYGGAVLLGTGIVFLALPEMGDTHSELYGLAPLPEGGAQFTYAGRF